MLTYRTLLAVGGLGLIAWALREKYPNAAANVVDIILDPIMEPIKAITSGPRGLRNNNPGNIVRTSERWQGMSADQSRDSRFVVFDSPIWGLRALARILRTYHSRGLVTVQQIIGRWAPPIENDTGAYIGAVAQAIGVSPAQPIELSADVLARIMEAIVKHENGQQPYSPELFAQAVQLERQS